jgi:hypothetical protein
MKLTKKDLPKRLRDLPADRVSIKHFDSKTQGLIKKNGGCIYEDGTTRVTLIA